MTIVIREGFAAGMRMVGFLLIGGGMMYGATACTPEPKAILAVERSTAGTPRLLVAPCSGYRATSLSVFRDGNSGDSNSWRLASVDGGKSIDAFDFLVAPPGWEVSEATLPELRESEKYVAEIDGSIKGKGLYGRIPFTLEDLQSLGDGEVLAGAWDTRVVSRADFLKGGSKQCKP
ncbi:hypothetical protein HET69_22430 [Streptomyces sp. CJ_13]|uniref:hypothetical protein n=1 Tax=Streptomyces sp. CJ_13 TaxID=2724943 RepID=UPI001BDD38EB|nr:hypothetical protein [Streptomyces sp. CJ_13]MBT1186682.1 hypothetical protein [Streptomyces sp. CJ_13]